jgi:hypothetical protein
MRLSVWIQFNDREGSFSQDVPITRQMLETGGFLPEGKNTNRRSRQTRTDRLITHAFQQERTV